MTFLFLLFVVFLLIWILRPIWRVYRSFNQMKNAFNQSAGSSRKYNQSDTTNNNRKSHKTASDEKIIPAEYGEYVEFTETTSYSEERNFEDQTRQRKVYKEEQISDAEWEEVK